MKQTCLGLFLALLFIVTPAGAYKKGSFGLGIAYFSQNILSMTAQKDTGEAKFLGETSYPLTLKYDFAFSGDWFFAPELTYTFMPRTTPGATAKVTTTHLLFQFGKNAGATTDWFVGPGLISYTYKGEGGTTVMNNGTTTATFAVPGKTTKSQQITMNIGGSITFGESRLGAELIVENLFSSKKRAESLLLGYSYQFGELF